MFWANFLHIYQPPAQKEYWVKKVAKESYEKLVEGFEKNPQAKVALNINACLIELLIKNKFKYLINRIKKLADRGQIEFTDSAKYHAFLPLLPEEEIIRQIKLNYETNRKYLGDSYRPKGFFPPEMAYSEKLAKIAKKLGYKWIILDELGFNGEIGNIDWRKTYNMKGLKNFKAYFRERETSFRILSAQVGTVGMLENALKDKIKSNQYLITAMDGETFGHHRPGLEHVLFNLYENPDIKNIFISDIPKVFPDSETISPLESSWALMKRDIERKLPFARWYDPKNGIQKMQWQLTNLAIKKIQRVSKRHPSYGSLRKLLDRALYSDQYWWASAQPWWSLEMIERGAKELKDIVLECPSSSKQDKKKAEEFYRNIVYTGFDWQRSGKVEEMSREADEDVTQRVVKEVPYIPKKEFDEMIGNLKQQMLNAARTQEYERAAQIRDRISELKEKEEEITRKK
ncbi:hypothetical protein COY23_02205 [bacterium (Candidatus Torokbacteria) CG_4_10_14_0_2_um_filter_35_8]|nr:MAG: hypothetical protein COY23_02205 [bacterium (Candidatus Torokbacteria) CG_4_10_14_0_2_um_filter_35_8]